jgi:recombination protein RecA
MALNAEQKRLLTNAKTALTKQWKSDSFLSNEIIKIPAISTGSIRLDKLIGIGGLPEGRLVEIFGAESCGKTTELTLVMIEAQKLYPDCMCALVDVENAFNFQYASDMGLDLAGDRFLITQPGSGEEALDTMLGLIKTGLFKVVALDSVGGLMTKSQLEKGIGDATMAEVARVLSQSLKKIVDAAKSTDTLVIFINQQRATMDMYGPKETTMGGKALPYWCSVRLKLRKKDVLKNGETPYGQTIDRKSVV